MSTRCDLGIEAIQRLAFSSSAASSASRPFAFTLNMEASCGANSTKVASMTFATSIHNWTSIQQWGSSSSATSRDWMRSQTGTRRLFEIFVERTSPIRPSSFTPLKKTMSARTMLRTSSVQGRYKCGSIPRLINCSTTTRLPPMCRTRSAIIPVVATIRTRPKLSPVCQLVDLHPVDPTTIASSADFKTRWVNERRVLRMIYCKDSRSLSAIGSFEANGSPYREPMAFPQKPASSRYRSRKDKDSLPLPVTNWL